MATVIWVLVRSAAPTGDDTIPRRASSPGQRQGHDRGIYRRFRRQRRNGGPDGKVLDDVAAPAVTALLNLRANNTFGLFRFRLRLHTRERQFASVVERLGVVLHLDVAADLLQRFHQALVGDVID